MTIKVEIKNVYGKELVYPICETAIRFARLVSQKTFTQREITIIKELGYTVEVVSSHKAVL